MTAKLSTPAKLLLAILISLGSSQFAQAAVDISMTPTPAGIEMGAQYNGLKLKVEGTIPAGSDVVLRFTGAPGELHLREKGKVMGLLWMNVGKVTVKNIPKVCIVDTSKSMVELGAEALPYGLDGVMDKVEVEESSTTNQHIDVDKELLQLKEEEGLFNESAQGITLGPDNGATRTFSAELDIPSALAPGNYHLDAVAIRDKQVVAKGEISVDAKLIGFPAWLSKLAFEKSLLYGVMATVIAIASGLAIGLIFESKGSH